ncbi:MAG TPA: M23 family metallopeptidase [Flavipsychrobacter sp.]|nr:M23 family metallopeptidase [Flavipsychrobacter sp.]
MRERVKKYYYNTETHRFEKYQLSPRWVLLRSLGFVSAAIVSAIIVVGIAFRFLDSPKEKKMRADMNELRNQYTQLQNRVNFLNESIKELEERDNSIYRGIFEAAPLPDSIRYGKKYSLVDVSEYAYMNPDEMLLSIKEGMNVLSHRIYIQRRSYDTLEHMVRSKEQMLQAIPAIQPISNKTLGHLASGFGYRVDPIYKTVKLHTGLDFAAPMGTPIYATGNGRVVAANYDNHGYGNHVIINHGYGYETLYGHMVRIKTRLGQVVNRGEVIGWIGSTGKSTGPHLHYEVIKSGHKIDPVHFFFNDLSAAEYERMVKISAAGNQSFD